MMSFTVHKILPLNSHQSPESALVVRVLSHSGNTHPHQYPGNPCRPAPVDPSLPSNNACPMAMPAIGVRGQ